VVGLLQFPRRAGIDGCRAFGIISLLPVEIILQVGSAAGFAMVFALLIAAISGMSARGISACPPPAHTR
jgi:PiT family inorganic phosphate transporter